MAKAKRASLADIMEQTAATPELAAPERSQGVVVPLVQPAADQVAEAAPVAATPQPGRGLRRDKPHTTIYLDQAVRNAIKRAAIEVNKKPHDLMLEGIDLMLIKYTGKTAKGHST
ncbi:MAG: hypothetical protein INF98_03540 [Roseomonas sp.]|jgi:hypothetical protein|nr:hypothetical protein [Roseomonas sp.]